MAQLSLTSLRRLTNRAPLGLYRSQRATGLWVDRHKRHFTMAEPEKKKVRVALFSVMEVSVHTLVNQVLEKRKDDVELALVMTCPGPKSRRSDAYIEVIQALWNTGKTKVDVVICNRKSMYAKYMKWYEIDLIVSMGYPWLLPEDILTPSKYPETSPRLGAINFHNSILPQYRGPNAFGWAICNGDSELGFCCHRMDGEFDTGPLLTTRTVPFDVNGTIEDLFEQAIPTTFLSLVTEGLDLALKGTPGTPQVGTPSQAPLFSSEMRWLDFANMTALEAHNRIRSFVGLRDIPKGALAKIDGKTLCILQSFYRPPPAEADNTVEPGTVISQSDDGSSFVVQFKDASLEIVKWKPHEEETSDK